MFKYTNNIKIINELQRGRYAIVKPRAKFINIHEYIDKMLCAFDKDGLKRGVFDKVQVISHTKNACYTIIFPLDLYINISEYDFELIVNNLKAIDKDFITLKEYVDTI